VDSLESDSPSLSDNMASPHTGSNRKRLQSTKYHNDTMTVNDLVASRVRKRTFRFASCLRFDTAVLRVVSGCKFSGELLQGTKVRARSIGSNRETSARGKVESVTGALTGQVCEHKSGFAVVAETWQFAGIAALGTL